MPDIRDLQAQVKNVLRNAGYSEAGDHTGFSVAPAGRHSQGQVRISVRVGRKSYGATTEDLERLMKQYRVALVYAEKFELWNSAKSGEVVESIVAEFKADEPALDAQQYTLHRSSTEHTLIVKVDGADVGKLVFNVTAGAWGFPGDPSRTDWPTRDGAVQALLLVRNMRQVLKFHVDEETVYENALLTALAALRSTAKPVPSPTGISEK